MSTTSLVTRLARLFIKTVPILHQEKDRKPRMSESERRTCSLYLQTLRDVVKSKIIYPLLVNRECTLLKMG